MNFKPQSSDDHSDGAHWHSRRALLARLFAERGQAMVEFALVVPVLLTVVMGIVDFGRAMNYDEQATHLANEAVRYAVVDQVPPGTSATSLGQWVRSQADTNELHNEITSVCLKLPNGTANPGDPVEVTVTFKFTFVPYLGLGSSTITRTATMRIEVTPAGSFFAPGCT